MRRRLLCAFVMCAGLCACSRPPRPAVQPLPQEPSREDVPPPILPEPTRARGLFGQSGPDVRIGLWVDSSNVRITAAGGLRVSVDGGREEAFDDTSFVARRGGDLETIVLASTHARDAESTGTRIIVRSRTAGVFVHVAGRPYRGTVEVFRGRAGGVTAVNVLPVEDYLRGVVPAEIGRLNDTAASAIQAQAVAARTYTLSYFGRRKEDGFDLLSTVQDQVYDGVAGEARTGDRAVIATRGVVAAYKNRYVRCNYFSTCGGRTAAIDEVWRESPLDFLRSIRDRAGAEKEAFCKSSKYYRWRERWPADEFLDLVASWGPRVYPESIGDVTPGELVAVRVRDRGPSKRVTDLEVRTQSGTYNLTGDRIRSVCRRPGAHEATLRSTLFNVTVERAQGRPVAVVFDGGGFGHGVGMCQVGAIGMSRAGYSLTQIIGHYYRGARLARLY
jgi:stage II sporulation protein D